MRKARVTLIAGLILTVVTIGVVLSHAPAIVASANGITAKDELGELAGSTKICQASETLSRGTSAMVISLSAFHGPRVVAEVRSNANIVTRGQQGSNWSGQTVTIPVQPLSHAIGHVTICVKFSARHEAVVPFGAHVRPTAAATDNGAALQGRLRIEDLRPGEQSWWSLAGSTAYHMGLGRIASGTWITILAAALMVAAAATAATTLFKELR